MSTRATSPATDGGVSACTGVCSTRAQGARTHHVQQRRRADGEDEPRALLDEEEAGVHGPSIRLKVQDAHRPRHFSINQPPTTILYTHHARQWVRHTKSTSLARESWGADQLASPGGGRMCAGAPARGGGVVVVRCGAPVPPPRKGCPLCSTRPRRGGAGAAPTRDAPTLRQGGCTPHSLGNSSASADHVRPFPLLSLVVHACGSTRTAGHL